MEVPPKISEEMKSLYSATYNNAQKVWDFGDKLMAICLKFCRVSIKSIKLTLDPDIRFSPK